MTNENKLRDDIIILRDAIIIVVNLQVVLNLDVEQRDQLYELPQHDLCMLPYDKSTFFGESCRLLNIVRAC